jgi:hypothetical protein
VIAEIREKGRQVNSVEPRTYLEEHPEESVIREIGCRCPAREVEVFAPRGWR